LHVPSLEAISFCNYVPIAAALNAIHMSQDLYVVESEDAYHEWGCRLPTSNCSLFTIKFPSISLLKLTVQLEFRTTGETGDQLYSYLLPNRLA